VGVIQSLQRDNEFFKRLSPNLRQQLSFTLLESYYQKFFFFFNDLDGQQFADDIFIRRVLTNLDCQVYLKDRTIIEVNQNLASVYFCYQNGVRLINPFTGLAIVDLPEGSFFGELQVLLGIKSTHEITA
jgi:hypothetical protein